MDSKRRVDSFSKQKKTQTNTVWKKISNFVKELCEKDVEQLTVSVEEERHFSQFADRSPSRSKDYYIIRQYLKEEFAQLGKELGYNLKEQIISSFKSEVEKEGEEKKEEETEKQTRQSYLYNQMIHLGTNVSNIYFSEDSKFVLKGIPTSQFNTFKQNLSTTCFTNNYSQINCLSVRVLGLYEICNEDKWNPGSLELPSNYYILMENILAEWNFDQHIIQSIYDLKGSSIGRNFDDSDHSSDSDGNHKDDVKANGSSANDQQNSFHVSFGKDNNFKTNEKDKEVLHSLPDDLKQELFRQLEEECKQYQQANIMDYSLMVVIGQKKQETKENGRLNQNQIICQQNKFKNILFKDYVITFGLIDYLTQYDLKKTFETTFKSFFCSNKDQISCVDPETYLDRIIKYVKKEVLSIQQEDEIKENS